MKWAQDAYDRLKAEQIYQPSDRERLAWNGEDERRERERMNNSIRRRLPPVA